MTFDQPKTLAEAGPQTGAAGATIEFRGLQRSFGNVRALAGLDLTVGRGELVALLGPSGCGKTTALRVVAGFEHPDAGEVLVDGEDITRVPAHRRDAGMVFQSYSLFPHLSALDNVAFGLRMRGVGRAERRARAGELLDLVGLPDRADRYPHQLSGGQQQRIALARALALRPRVLLLDEPLSALDARVRLTLRDEIRRLQQELGITTLFVTHDQEEALSLADRVAVMNAGRLEQCAPPAELYARPATAFVAEFVGVMSRVPAHADGAVVRVLGRTLPIDGDPAHGDVDVLLRPESIEVVAAADGSAQVLGAAFLGAVTRLSVRSAAGATVKIDIPSHVAATLPLGSRVELALPERPVLVAPRKEPARSSSRPPHEEGTTTMGVPRSG
ncbi:ABC transporter ATP-binding protein [Embleya sp. NPDC050493]|uniref:ABC transporter ATP-binding protein n=1 Tax=Embleya sp. NPDC050493 TaxID=3363989 RepID=UPI0037B99AC5